MQHEIFSKILEPIGNEFELGSVMDCGDGVFNVDVK